VVKVVLAAIKVTKCSKCRGGRSGSGKAESDRKNFKKLLFNKVIINSLER